jgi:hypothetical protein
MTDRAAYPDNLDECHRLLARLQAQCALHEQKLRAWDEREQRYAELQKSHQQTSADLLKLREDYQDVLHQLQLLRRWAFGARRERFVDDPRQKHLFDLDSIRPPSITAPNPEASSTSESETEQEAAEKRAAAREKKRADRKLCLSVKTSVACSNSFPLSCMFTIITERSMAAPAESVASRCLRCIHVSENPQPAFHLDR